MVDKVWQARLATGDPLDGLLHKEHVRVVLGVARNVDKPSSASVKSCCALPAAVVRMPWCAG